MADFPTTFVRLTTDRSYQVKPGTSSTQIFTAAAGYSATTDGPWVLLSIDGYGQRIPANQVTNFNFDSSGAATTPIKGTLPKGLAEQGHPADPRGIPLGTDANEQSSLDPREVPKAPKEPTEAEAKDARTRADAELKKREAEGELKKAEKKLEDAQAAEQKAHDASPVPPPTTPPPHDATPVPSDLKDIVDRATKPVETTYERDGKTTTGKKGHK